MNTRFRHALALAVSLGCLIALAPTLASAAAGPAKSASTQRFQTWRGAGLRLDVPRGHTVTAETFADARPDQATDAVEILRGKDVVTRVDVFANPKGLSARQWLAGDQAFLAGRGVVVTDEPARGKRTAVRLVTPKTPQSLAREIVLVSTPSRLLRVTCDRRDDGAAREVLERAAATVEPTATPRRKP